MLRSLKRKFFDKIVGDSKRVNSLMVSYLLVLIHTMKVHYYNGVIYHSIEKITYYYILIKLSIFYLIEIYY